MQSGRPAWFFCWELVTFNDNVRSDPGLGTAQDECDWFREIQTRQGYNDNAERAARPLSSAETLFSDRQHHPLTLTLCTFTLPSDSTFT